jgi:hypothetical protein
METLWQHSQNIGKSEVEGSTPKGAGPFSLVREQGAADPDTGSVWSKILTYGMSVLLAKGFPSRAFNAEAW